MLMHWVTIASVLISASFGLHTTSKVEQQARDLIADANNQLPLLLNATMRINFFIDNGFFEDENVKPQVLGLLKYLVEEYVNTTDKAKALRKDLILDEDLKHQLKKLDNVGLWALREDYFTKVLVAANELKKIATDKTVCEYSTRDVTDCNMLALIPDIRRVFFQNRDAHELEYYWTEWRAKTLNSVKRNLKTIIESFEKAAELNGVTSLDIWFSMYQDPDFLKDMEDVMKQIKPFYEEFHAYVRNVLHKKYGELVIKADGPIPIHLYEQIVLQAWRKDSLLEQPYPQMRLPNIQAEFDWHDVSALRIVELADELFTSMGLKAFPHDFWSRHIRQKNKLERGPDCKAETFDAIKDISLKYCPRPSFKRFLQLHVDLARLHYAIEKENLPYIYFDSYDFEYAVGEAFTLAASTPRHIQRIGLLKDYDYNEQLSMNRLFRLGLHTMFNIPVHFVHTKVIAELLSGETFFEELNHRYWMLMEEYVGVEPPYDRYGQKLDFPYKFYERIDENHQARKFVSEILGYQFYRALCKKSGGYVRGDQNLPLQNCDFYGSAEAGTSLRRMMAVGSTKPWKQVLAEVIDDDEPDLNAAALLEFYEPLRNWLEEQNSLNNVKIGWNPSNKAA